MTKPTINVGDGSCTCQGWVHARGIVGCVHGPPMKPPEPPEPAKHAPGRVPSGLDLGMIHDLVTFLIAQAGQDYAAVTQMMEQADPAAELSITGRPLHTLIHMASEAGDTAVTEAVRLRLAEIAVIRGTVEYYWELQHGAGYFQREGDREVEREYRLQLEAVAHVLRLQSLRYTERPGYQQAWRPLEYRPERAQQDSNLRPTT